jgi:hypothetical protein
MDAACVPVFSRCLGKLKLAHQERRTALSWLHGVEARAHRVILSDTVSIKDNKASRLRTLSIQEVSA